MSRPSPGLGGSGSMNKIWDIPHNIRWHWGDKRTAASSPHEQIDWDFDYIQENRDQRVTRLFTKLSQSIPLPSAHLIVIVHAAFAEILKRAAYSCFLGTL